MPPDQGRTLARAALVLVGAIVLMPIVITVVAAVRAPAPARGVPVEANDAMRSEDRR